MSFGTFMDRNIQRASRLPRQLTGASPFAGDIKPTRVRLFASGRPTAPFPHPWNFHEPLQILETYFVGAERFEGSSRHNRYLDAPGFAPVLVTRDPEVIRAISTDTGHKDGQFDRDTMPSIGIARATGEDSLLYANGEAWKHQKKLATPPFARTSLYQPDQFQEFEQTFRSTVRSRLCLLHDQIEPGGSYRVQLETEIKAIMLEMLVNCFFGADIAYDEIKARFVPALDRVIDHIVRDTILNRLGIPLRFIPSVNRGIARAKVAKRDFEELTDRVIEPRRACKGQWGRFTSDAPDDALRSNIRVFLAGALEATTSYASWALSHLARDAAWQQRVHDEVASIEDYSPETLAQAGSLNAVLNETLRLTPSLYFHPRRATVDRWIETTGGATLRIPRGTHVLLDVWHANRHDDHWGTDVTGYPASDFAPARWEDLAAAGKGPNDLLHFGFGHGPRFCPGKSLGQLEVALVVGSCVKLFEFSAVNSINEARAGVSTKPRDGALVDLHLRDRAAQAVTRAHAPARCPFGHGASDQSDQHM